MIRIGAVIVVFFPEPERLSMLLKRLEEEQIDTVIVDNGGGNSSLFGKVLKVFTNSRNEGLSKALNIGAIWLLNKNYDFVAFFDQDSIPGPGFFNSPAALFKAEEDLGIVFPFVRDKRNIVPTASRIFSVRYGITSGSIVRSKVFESIGLHDEKMFIDLVDFDFCIRARQKGWRLVQDSKIYIDHNLGRLQQKTLLFVSFFPTFHSAERRYYRIRNSIYLMKKHGLSVLSFHLRNVLRTSKEIAEIMLFEDGKCGKFASMMMGLIDGFLGRMGDYRRFELRSGKSARKIQSR